MRGEKRAKESNTKEKKDTMLLRTLFLSVLSTMYHLCAFLKNLCPFLLFHHLHLS